ncbi:aldolase/citrate lyase family protein [Hansschlegelia plantiphila]|uniref:CoA ester lyase n=1 Tax=Hansschlegelia plantiphila TaxID=374655 RepID=A0A9W6MVJ0_9HYPH|nr:aldolase/citrate lyase family protein [Hansschlegelia plantiphila]GLK67946.1 CoA ester lyase [Hansschlegelia plantiphila]
MNTPEARLRDPNGPRPRAPLLVQPLSEAALDAAWRSGADAVILDIGQAREVADARPAPSELGIYLRIDGLVPSLAGDLAAAASSRLAGVVLGRAADGAEVQNLAASLAVVEARIGLEDGSIGIVAEIASGAGLLRLATFAGASDRLRAVCWDADALAHDIGAASARGDDGDWIDPCRTARSLTLAAAAAAGLPAIDCPFVGDDQEAFRREAEQARRDGFAAKIAGDPGQIEAVRAVWMRG